jgi:LysR family transcriptional regulator, regulator for metE and metH
MSLEVRDLRLVEAVAKLGSLTRAATVLNLTQSALSHQLADLERRLGTQVFMRAGRKMVLTPAGERLREGAASILSALAATESSIRSTSEARRLLLRMSTECYTCYHWLPTVLREYQERFPTVETRILAEMTHHPLPALLRGELDLAIVSQPVANRRLVCAPLFRDEMVAVCSPEHRWAGRRFVAARDFASENLISYVLSRADSTLFQEVLLPAGISPQRETQVQLTEAIVELVKAGVGVAALARWAVAPHLDAGTLCAVRLTERGIQRHWHAVYKRYKAVPQHIHAFVTLLSRDLRGSAPLTLKAEPTRAS